SAIPTGSATPALQMAPANVPGQRSETAPDNVSPDKAAPLPIPSQTMVFFQKDPGSPGTPPPGGNSPATPGGKVLTDNSASVIMPQIKPDSISVTLPVPPGHRLWKPDADVVAQLHDKIKELGECETVEYKDGVWVVRQARRYASEIAEQLASA